MTTRFRYSPSATATFVDAVQGQTIVLEETREYSIEFPAPLGPEEQLRFREVGGKLLRPDFGVITFSNFIGSTTVGGVSVEVTSQKLNRDSVSLLLQEISAMGAALIFSWKTPVFFQAGTSFEDLSPIPYHQYQFLRQSMLLAQPGSRLQDFLAAVERNPIRKFEVERPVVSIQRARRLDSTALRSVFSRLDRLAPVPLSSTLYTNPLAQRLTFGEPSSPHFPAKIAAATRTLTLDTPENRFVKHVFKEALALTYRFTSHVGIHESMRTDSGRMQAILESLMGSPILDEAGPLTSFQGPSQALAKADGYRDVYLFWTLLTRHLSIPLNPNETTTLLEGRDIAKLYEYWVFLRVLKSTLNALNQTAAQQITLQRSELGESIGSSLLVRVTTEVSVQFNPTFSRSKNSAYSSPLRPDVILEAHGLRYAFDAKYKLERLTIADDDPDEADATYRQADLYKMHTYRDAISNLRSAVAVYPGTEFVFFEKRGLKATAPDQIMAVSGVGAVPLRPTIGADTTLLDDMVGRCISDSKPTLL